MTTVGKLFEKEIRQLLERENVLLIKQYDILGERFCHRKVFDFAALSPEGHFVGVEAKATKQDRWDFSQIKPHQRENLTRVAKTEHGRAYLALNFREEKQPGKAWLISWKWWIENFEKKWGKKSIRREEAVKEFRDFELARITNGWKTQP